MNQKLLELLLERLLNEDSPENPENYNDIGKYVIIRTYSAGVHAGILISKNKDEVILRDSRRIHYWDGASSLSQLAMEGTKTPNNCRFAMVLPKITLPNMIETIPCSKEGEKNIKEVSIWKE